MWACLSGVDALPPSVLCVLSHMLEAVASAVQAGGKTCQLLCGGEVRREGGEGGREGGRERRVC